MADLDRVLAIVSGMGETFGWPQQEYERILLSPPVPLVKRFALGAEADGTLVGFAVTRFILGDEIAELEMIVVELKYRRLGLGRDLLRSSIITAARAGAKTMRLEVRVSNSAAISLYRSCGFTVAGRRPSYYSSPPEDALLFAFDLPI